MAKKKYYVVWHGVEPGIYESWNECKAQVAGFDGARYKSFSTLEEAEEAYGGNPWMYIGKSSRSRTAEPILPNDAVIRDSVSVDAACSGNPGLLEYRGVYTGDGAELFRMGPLEQGTNNVGEFLAIVHALALLKQKNSTIPIYTDSVNAIKWIERKKCNTKLQKSAKNQPLFDLIERAESWIEKNSWQNKILKWETRSWGEIPADFGRKR